MSSAQPVHPIEYEIRVRGHLDDKWAGRFAGLHITRRDDSTTVLRGPLADQAALHGVIATIRDLNLPLISVRKMGPGEHQEEEE